MTLLHWRIGAVARARAGYQLSVSSYRRLRLSLSHLCYVPILHAVCRSPATAIRLNKCISDEFQSRERAESRSGIHQLGVAVVGGRAPALPTMGAEEGGMMRGFSFSFCKFTSTRERERQSHHVVCATLPYSGDNEIYKLFLSSA